MSSDPIEVLRKQATRLDCIGAKSEAAAIRGAAHDLESALASLSAPKPEGEWVMVPRKPTEAMLSHGEGWEYSTVSDGAAMARQVYADMLAAAPKPSPMNDNAVAVNEVAPVNDKPESAEAVCPDCHGEGGRRWYEADGSERGETCGTCDGFGTAPQQASAPVGVDDIAVELEYYANCPGRVLALAGKLRDLAQQPAAVDSEMVIRAVNAYDEATGEGWQMPCLQGMRAALTAALAAQQGGES